MLIPHNLGDGIMIDIYTYLRFEYSWREHTLSFIFHCVRLARGCLFRRNLCFYELGERRHFVIRRYFGKSDLGGTTPVKNHHNIAPFNLALIPKMTAKILSSIS